MARGDNQEAGKPRKARMPDIVAARVKRLYKPVEATLGVIPLNPGFFAMQRMGVANASKLREEKP